MTPEGKVIEFLFDESGSESLPVFVISEVPQAIQENASWWWIVIRDIGVAGLTIFVFRFLSFANLLILYSFLNIGLLSIEVRVFFREGLKILFSGGILSSTLEYFFNVHIDYLNHEFLVFFPEKAINDLTKGTSFREVGFSSNYCTDDAEEMAIAACNCIKVIVIYLFFRLLHYAVEREWIHLGFVKFQKAAKLCVLIELIALAPKMSIVAGSIAMSHMNWLEF